jgi:hypothetical protein
MLAVSEIIIITPKVHTNRRNKPNPDATLRHIGLCTPEVLMNRALGGVGGGGGPAVLPPISSYLYNLTAHLRYTISYYSHDM